MNCGPFGHVWTRGGAGILINNGEPCDCGFVRWSEPGRPDAVGDLQRENEALRAEVARLTEERDQLARDFVGATLRELRQRELAELIQVDADRLTQPAVLRWLRAHGWTQEADTIETGAKWVEAAAKGEAGR